MPDEVTIVTTDGVALEAEHAMPTGPVRAAAVLLHPHPLHGGSMHTPVPDALFTTLPGAGVACLRLNFRGVGRSGGDHDGGRGEVEDVRAGVSALATAVPGVPVWLVGWSFGADVSLTVADPVVAGWVAVAPPLAVVDPSEMAAGRDHRPTRLLVPEHDQFSDPERAGAVTGDWASTEVEVVPGTDHFLAGGLALVCERVVATVAPEP